MINRCCCKTHPAYKYYGGRGIKVYSKWRKDFQAFFDYIGPKPLPVLSLDRIDNDGDYKPGNVRWATASQQARNRRYCPTSPFG